MKLEEQAVNNVRKSLVESVDIVNQVSQCNQWATHHARVNLFVQEGAAPCMQQILF